MFTYSEFQQAFLSQYPQIDPLTLPCLFTGAPAGFLDERDSWEIIQTLSDDVEEAADDWAMRLMASARPSVRWNRIAIPDVARLRVTHPVETLSYLLNGGAGLRFDDHFFESMLKRVRQYRSLWLESEYHPHVFEWRWLDFYRKRDEALAESQRAARAMAHWLEQADPLGQESQRRKRIQAIEDRAEAIRLGRIKGPAPRPVSERTQKQREHAKKLSMASAFLDEIFKTPTPAPVTDAPKPATPKVVGFRIGAPKKDS